MNCSLQEEWNVEDLQKERLTKEDFNGDDE
jgi:hypothetical protein